MSRSVKKGPFVSFHILEHITSINKKGLRRVIHTWSRSSVIIPIIIGHTVSVYNGNHHVSVFIKDLMVGHKLGEFSRTRLYSRPVKLVKNIKHF
jgi:small subunit ribosomal protein S19